ncbi:MAG TPA: hypothetical protein PL037_02495, partial [Elusimicrobiales bacterium]|nr:hypothetical protein [Elusimicrobiales bacterium]
FINRVFPGSRINVKEKLRTGERGGGEAGRLLFSDCWYAGRLHKGNFLMATSNHASKAYQQSCIRSL